MSCGRSFCENCALLDKDENILVCEECGAECTECGKITFNPVNCEDCDAILCTDCVEWCTVCEGLLCAEKECGQTTCQICEEYACVACRAKTGYNCDTCGWICAGHPMRQCASGGSCVGGNNGLYCPACFPVEDDDPNGVEFFIRENGPCCECIIEEGFKEARNSIRGLDNNEDVDVPADDGDLVVVEQE